MTINEFLQLDLNVRAEIAWHGTFIADRTEDQTNIQLYYLTDFFAEISYNLIDEEIITINAFRNPELLNKYSEKIDISGLLV
jgi:dienelactone hydrolase